MARYNKPKFSLSPIDVPDSGVGGGGYPLFLDDVEQWAWRTNIFSTSELDTIISIGNQQNLDKARTQGSTSEKVRNSFVRFLYPNDVTGWIFQRMSFLINEMNHDYFHFDLTGMEQGLQFTKYSAPGQHYTWHIDRCYQMPTRKLSVSIQLSDPSDYDGGLLQLKLGDKGLSIQKERGRVTAFPSWTLHRVTPVTKGTRYSLVAWVSGPPFK